MGPRKRSKPNPEAEAELRDDGVETSPTVEPSAFSKKDASSQGQMSKDIENATSSPNAEPSASVEPKRTWYGGTWPRSPKATPVTQVAKESISAASAVASEAISSAQRRVSPRRATPLRTSSAYLSRASTDSSKSPALVATTTKLNVTSNNAESSKSQRRNPLESQPTAGLKDGTGFGARTSHDKNSSADIESSDGANEGGNKRSSADILDAEDKRSDPQNSKADMGWVGWFSRSVNTNVEMPDAKEPLIENAQEGGSLAKPGTVTQSNDVKATATVGEGDLSAANSTKASLDSANSSWLGLWGVSRNKGSDLIRATSPQNGPKPAAALKAVDQAEPQTGQVTNPSLKTSQQHVETSKTNGWAFWTRDPSIPGNAGKDKQESHEQARLDEPSRTNPRLSEGDQRNISGKGEENSKDGAGEKRQRPLSSGVSSKNNVDTPGLCKENDAAKSEITTSVTKAEKSKVTSMTSKPRINNLLLPSLDLTYGATDKPGILQQIGRLLQPSRTSIDAKHVNLESPPRIKRALAIGVHGYFPAPLIRSVLGQPTGTSIRFANGAATAIERWTSQQGYTCEVEKIALEGEGRIAERLDLLWKLLLNWIEDIRKADFIMIACHSQGVPVAIMLISKLISFGCLQGARVGVCAMAGVNLGPFGDYKSRWISGSAGELFDFAKPSSQVSKDYTAALNVSLKFGVRISYIGSIDDQLVSLESSTFGTLVHPYVFRAVLVDGRLHAPDFLSHLVGFALKLRNLGITDHGLIRELSAPLAGSLYGGEGHSRIYDDDAVYSLALRYALESSSLGDVPPRFTKADPISTPNPYILPFAMRGLLEEDFVKAKLQDETTELLQQFDDWKPSSKVLKDVKFRLEGVRSKL